MVEIHAIAGQATVVRKNLGHYWTTLKTGAGERAAPTGKWAVRKHDSATPPADFPWTGAADETPPTNFPATATRLVGRAAAAARLRDLISSHRVVTVTGTGGIGKTSLALNVARRILGDFPDGGWLVELASLDNPALVQSSVARALGVTLNGEQISVEAVARAVGNQHLLLLLDNCEHIVEAAAKLVDTCVRRCPRVTILATSREALRIDGEAVYPLAPLEVPAIDQQQPDVIQNHSAVRLFIARTTASNSDFKVGARELLVIAEICRHLDGIPLAIEFAATRAATLGVAHVSSSLGDRFAALTTGLRNAAPRHRTLLAVLDWSYQLLAEQEKSLLRHLAIFRAGFTLEAAAAVAGDEIVAAPTMLHGLMGLVSKSLVTSDGSDQPARWRLLETIRAYALQKLAEQNETETARRRHAKYLRNLFAPSGMGACWRLSCEELAVRARELDNVRESLDWCFSPSGDAETGKHLTAACLSVWLYLGLPAECREWCERALRVPDQDSGISGQRRVWLRTGFGAALIGTMGTAEQTKAVLLEAIEEAEQLGELDTMSVALFRLAPMLSARGEHDEAWAAVERLARIGEESTETDVVVAADRLKGLLLLGSGRLAEAGNCLERVLRFPAAREGERRLYWSHSDHRAVTRAMLARTLCLRGFVERAQLEAEASMADLPGPPGRLSVCRVIALGLVRVALLTGNLPAADQAIARLSDVANRGSAPFWQVEGRFLRGTLMVARREFAAGAAVLREAFDTCRRARWRGSYPEFKGALVEALAGDGRLDEARATIDEAIASALEEGDSQIWYVPELLRIKGETLSPRSGGQSTAPAEDCFRRASDMARQQGALLWELRIALSFASMRVMQGRTDEGRRLLAPVYDRFTEGFETPHLRAAKALLMEPR
jgi:predicted ATPase